MGFGSRLIEGAKNAKEAFEEKVVEPIKSSYDYFSNKDNPMYQKFREIGIDSKDKFLDWLDDPAIKSITNALGQTLESYASQYGIDLDEAFAQGGFQIPGVDTGYELEYGSEGQSLRNIDDENHDRHIDNSDDTARQLFNDPETPEPNVPDPPNHPTGVPQPVTPGAPNPLEDPNQTQLNPPPAIVAGNGVTASSAAAPPVGGFPFGVGSGGPIINNAGSGHNSTSDTASYWRSRYDSMVRSYRRVKAKKSRSKSVFWKLSKKRKSSRMKRRSKLNYGRKRTYRRRRRYY